MCTPYLRFAKMNGLGNKIIILDARKHKQAITSDAAILIAKNDILSFDQIMELYDVKNNNVNNNKNTVDTGIRVINRDGSDAQICGNGNRCVALWLHKETGKKQFYFDTNAGILLALVQNNQICVSMGSPKFEWDQIPLAEAFLDTSKIELQVGPIDNPLLHTPSVVNISNPHAIFWINDDLQNYDLENIGPLLENHPIFPQRANISIAKVINRKQVEIRTWERGTGATKACGSAACATLCAAHRKGLMDRKAVVTVPNGNLVIEWKMDDQILMTGPAEFEFSGFLNPKTGDLILDKPAKTNTNQ